MFKLYFYGAFFTSVCIRVFADQCYYGGVLGPNGNHYTVNNIPTSWSGSESGCYNKLGHLSSSTNAFSNAFLFNISIDAAEFWLGGYNYNGVWNWRNSGIIQIGNYTNWAPGEPSHNQSGYCIAMIKATGKWRADICTEKKPSVCELPISRAWDYGKCDPSLQWEWHPEVNRCYYNNGGLTDTSFNGTLDNCKMAFPLAGPMIIHSDQEMSVVQGMMDGYTGNGCAERFMLGIHDPDNNGHYVWADGSAVDYTGWDPDSPPPPGACFFAFARGENEWNPSLCEVFGVSNGIICQYTP